MADDIEFGGAEEMLEADLPEGMTVDVDAVDDADDADVAADDADDSLIKPNPFDDEEKNQDEQTDLEEEAYFFDEDKGFDAR